MLNIQIHLPSIGAGFMVGLLSALVIATTAPNEPKSSRVCGTLWYSNFNIMTTDTNNYPIQRWYYQIQIPRDCDSLRADTHFKMLQEHLETLKENTTELTFIGYKTKTTINE
jgi:hypothetical protein